MSNQLHLEIVTPHGQVYAADTDSVVLPTPAGELGILPGHLPLIVLLNPGEVRAISGGQTHSLAVDSGFVKVSQDKVSVLTEAAIQVEAIDLAKLEEARHQAEQRLLDARNSKEIDPDEIERLQALIRFQLAQEDVKTHKPTNHPDA